MINIDYCKKRSISIWVMHLDKGPVQEKVAVTAKVEQDLRTNSHDITIHHQTVLNHLMQVDYNWRKKLFRKIELFFEAVDNGRWKVDENHV